jgi:hypothetical protein
MEIRTDRWIGDRFTWKVTLCDLTKKAYSRFSTPSAGLSVNNLTFQVNRSPISGVSCPGRDRIWLASWTTGWMDLLCWFPTWWCDAFCRTVSEQLDFPGKPVPYPPIRSDFHINRNHCINRTMIRGLKLLLLSNHRSHALHPRTSQMGDRMSTLMELQDIVTMTRELRQQESSKSM